MRRWMIATGLALRFGATMAAPHDGDFFGAFLDQGRQRVMISQQSGTSGYDGVLAVQSTGRIIVASDSDLGISSQPDFYVKRLNADGTPDATFANGAGEQIVAFDRGGDNADYLSSMAIQDDGRILLAGASNGAMDVQCAVVRLTADGLPDANFSGSGKKSFSFGQAATPQDRCYSVAVQQDGRIVLAGNASTGSKLQMAVARLAAIGNFDPDFTSNINSTGKAVLDFGAAELGAIAFRARELPDGGILVVGEEVQATGAGWGLVKLDATGAVDTQFGDNGYVYYQLGLGGDLTGDAQALDFVALPDSSFVVVGGGPTGGPSGADMAIVKFTSAGAVDTTWGQNGRRIVQLDFGGDNDDVATSIVRDAQGRFVVAGTADVSDVLPSGGSDFVVLRLTAEGQFDKSFGFDGIETVQLAVPPAQNLNQRANSVAIAGDGGILVAGPAASTVNGSPYGIGVAKLYGDGIFATGFGD